MKARDELNVLLETFNGEQIEKILFWAKSVKTDSDYATNKEIHEKIERCSGCVNLCNMRIGRGDSMVDYRYSCKKYKCDLFLLNYENNFYDKFVQRCNKCKNEKGKRIVKGEEIISPDEI